jgi:cytochrome c oxidase subunit 2
VALAVVLVVIVLGAVVLTVSGIWWLPPLASNWGSVDIMMVITVALTGLAFIAVNLFIAYVVYRYRHREGRQALFQPDHHNLEKWLIVVTTIGIVVLLAPGLYFYAQFISPPQKDSLTVEVLAQQWMWSYRYPGQDGVLGRADPKLISTDNAFGIDAGDPGSRDDILLQGSPLHLPMGKAVRLQLRSVDVIHSFSVPEFRIRMDVVPGLVTNLWFVPEKIGTFEVLCTEVCGIGHFNMLSKIVVESPDDFQKWLQQQPTVAQTMGSQK